MRALVVALTAFAALVQAAAIPALFAEPLAAPVLPAAVVAAWAIVRGPEETWPALPLPAVILGALSDERMGWFLLALLPAPIFGALLAARARHVAAGVLRRSTWAAGAAAAAALLYGAVLAFAGGVAGDLPGATAEALAGALLTAGVAAVLALCAWPLRERQRGLFA